jgi:hypothetical protein
MLNGLAAIDWSSFAQPTTPDRVPAALQRLASAKTKEQGVVGYNAALYAFGNGHAGTYYPVVIPAVPFLGELLRCGSDVVREAVLDVLIELVGSFWPEPGFTTIRDPDGRERNLLHALHEAVVALRADITTGAVPDTPRGTELVQELLWFLDQPPKDLDTV